MNEGPLTIRDFSRGRYAKSAIAPSLTPENSVANSINVNFDEIIGSAKVRAGTTPIGNQIVGPLSTKDTFTTNDSDSDFYDTHWLAQTVTPAASFTLKFLKLKIFRTGTLSAGWRVRIFPTSAGAPVTSGSPLSVSGPMDTANIATGTGTDYLFPMSDYNMVAGTTYAIVVDIVGGGDGTHKLNWKGNLAGGASGKGYNSSNSGSTWSAFATFDLVYTLYGITAGTATPLGYTQYRTFAGSQLNDLVAIFDLTSQLAAASAILPAASSTKNAVMYYYNGTNWAPGYVGIEESVKTRFAVFGGRLFFTNSVDGMLQTDDPANPPVTSDCITTDNVKPSLIMRSLNRLLASGYDGFSSRVYFSSIISPNSSPFITWNTDPTTGNWIDLNPDDGGINTGFALTPSTTLVFKNNGFYRLDSINKTASIDPVSPIGAVSQESITNCQGVVYYFSGTGIWRTNGDVPELISRLGVQDFIDAIPQANWANVSLGADDFTVRVSIGDVTLNQNQDGERTYQNVVLKFSVRDQSWSVHSYADEFRYFSQYLTTSGAILTELDLSGYAQRVDYGMTDNTAAINFEVETQDLEFGDRSHLKILSDKMVSFNKYGLSSSLQLKADGGDYTPVRQGLDDRVNICKDLNVQGYFITLKWFGQSEGKSPIWEGFDIPTVTDQGVIEDG